MQPGAEGPPLPCASGCAPGVLKNVGRTNAENTKSARRSESTANTIMRQCATVHFLESQPLDIDCGKFIQGAAKEGSGTDLRRLLGPRASRIPHAHVTALPSASSTFPSPAHTSAQSDSRVRLIAHDGLHHRLQRRREGGGCPRATRRAQAQRRRARRQGFRDARAVQEGTSLERVALPWIEPVENREGVPWRRRDETERTPLSLKWIGDIARFVSICAFADAPSPPSPADRAHGRPRARQDRRG